MSEPLSQFPRTQRLRLDAGATALLAERVLSRGPSGRRAIIGIAGIPASGKSTLAGEVVRELNQRQPGSAILIPMDGFHLSNQRLEDLGLRGRKGSPSTFDAVAYIELLRQAREASRELCFPVYDRELHEPVLRQVPGQQITRDTRYILTEGNYLLLDQPPWSALRDVLDETWYIHTPIETAEQWILARHIRGGRSPDDARTHYLRNDLPNAMLVQQHLRRPDLWLQRSAS